MPLLEMLAGSVVSVLVPYLAKGAEEFVKSAGKDAYEKVKELIGAVRAKLAKDKEGASLLELTEANPKRYAPLLQEVLEETMAKDEEFGKTLETIMNKMGPAVNVIQKIGQGKDVTAAEIDSMTSGTLNLEQEVESGEKVYGLKLGKLG